MSLVFGKTGKAGFSGKHAPASLYRSRHLYKKSEIHFEGGIMIK